jgi:hypothetical protein
VICAEQGGSYHLVRLRSRNHVYPGLTVSFGVFETE